MLASEKRTHRDLGDHATKLALNIGNTMTHQRAPWLDRRWACRLIYITVLHQTLLSAASHEHSLCVLKIFCKMHGTTILSHIKFGYQVLIHLCYSACHYMYQVLIHLCYSACHYISRPRFPQPILSRTASSLSSFSSQHKYFP